MKSSMSIEDLENLMSYKQKRLSEQEMSHYVGTFWDYFHLAYCS